MEVEEELVQEVLDEDEMESGEESRPPSPSRHPLHIYQQTERPLITGSLRGTRTYSMKNELVGPQSVSLRSNRPTTHRTVSAASSDQRNLYPDTKIINCKKLSTSSFLEDQ